MRFYKHGLEKVYFSRGVKSCIGYNRSYSIQHVVCDVVIQRRGRLFLSIRADFADGADDLPARWGGAHNLLINGDAILDRK